MSSKIVSPTKHIVIRRHFTGVVISTAMKQALVISIQQTKWNAKYQTRYQRTRKFMASIPAGVAYKVGDHVTIEASRPRSKNIRWSVVGKVESKKI